VNSERKAAPKQVAVVGGGIVGLALAWRAAQNGHSVTVFDKGCCGSEASWAGAGMLAPGGEVENDSDYSRQLIGARALYPAFLSELEFESDRPIEFQANGALDLAYSDGERDALAARTSLQSSLGIASKPITADHVRTFWPSVRAEGLIAARFVPGDAVVNPRDVVEALRLACERRGVLLRENCEVKTVAIRGNGALVDDRSFDTAVIAAGAWSSEITLEGLPALPLSEPVRGHLVGYQQPFETLTTIVRHERQYLLQRANGLLIAGASAERAGFDRAIDPEAVERLESGATFVIPQLAETKRSEAWNGFRPAAEKLHAGAWHSTRLLLAYGHFRNGILLAPATARQIARLI
jgi:glycine oxidase